MKHTWIKQTLAEAWVRARDPAAFAARELDGPWKDRPASDGQVAFCLRHGIDADSAWTRAQARRAMDRHVLLVRAPTTHAGRCVGGGAVGLGARTAPFLTRNPLHINDTSTIPPPPPPPPPQQTNNYCTQEMRVPASDEQLFHLRHLGAFLPPTVRAGRAHRYARAVDAAIAAALTSGPGGAAGGGARAAGAPLPARAALLADCRRLWAAGLGTARHAWVSVNADGDLALDALSGCVAWLRRARPGLGLPLKAAAGDGGAGGGGAQAAGSAAASAAVQQGQGGRDASAAAATLGAEQQPLDPAAWPPLDPEALYVASLELADGRHVPLTPRALADADALFWPLTRGAGRAPRSGTAAAERAAAAAAAGGGGADAGLWPPHERRGGDADDVDDGDDDDAAGSDDDAGSGSGGGGGGGGDARTRARFVAAPLRSAFARAELLLGRLATARVAFHQPRHAHRVAGALGGWKVAGAHGGAGAAAAPQAAPASARQLDELRALGLPAPRRYAALDAERELLRARKARGLRDPPATPAQLARIAELGLALPPRPPLPAFEGGVPDVVGSSGSGGSGAGSDSAAAPAAAASAGAQQQQQPLTYAQARALLFRAALDEEEREAAAGAAAAALAPAKLAALQRERGAMARLKRRARLSGLRLDA